MNILHIITHYDPVVYGAENFAKQLAEYQASQNDNKIWVITGKWESGWPENEEINGVKVIRVNCLKIRYLQTVLAIFPLFSKASEIIIKHKINYIHTHIYPGMIVGFWLQKRHKIRYVATIQGGDIGDYDEVFGPFKSVAKLVIGYCLRKAFRVHCVSNYLANKVELLGVSRGKIVTIPNGVDIKKYHWRGANKSQSTQNDEKDKKTPMRLITTSRLEKKNNLIQLIELVNNLNKKGYNFTLDIFGTGSLEGDIKNRINDLSIGELINLRGYIEQDKLVSILPDYDLFIRLSVQEGFGISFIEAMACSVIPIGTPTGGIVDIIKHQYNGYLISLDGNLYDNFLKIIRDKKNWQNIKANGRKTIEQSFDWDVILPKINSIYA